jgi:hypothetical protein
MDNGLIVLTFIATAGAEKETFKQEFPKDVQFFKTISEIARKLRMSAEDIVITVPGGSALTNSDFYLTVEEVTNRYKNTFTIINRGIVG